MVGSLALAACAHALPPSPAGVGGTLRVNGPPGADGPAGPVVVMLEPTGATPRVDRVARLSRVESGTDRFGPPFSAVGVGDYIVFVNEGAISHRLFSADLASDVQIPVAPRSSSDLVRLDEKGEVRFFCSLHPDEHFSVLVTDAANFAVPDATGRYYLGPVPEGTYHLSVWTRTRRTAIRTVEVPPGHTLDEPIRLDPDVVVR